MARFYGAIYGDQKKEEASPKAITTTAKSWYTQVSVTMTGTSFDKEDTGPQNNDVTIVAKDLKTGESITIFRGSEQEFMAKFFPSTF